ncbi:MAG: DNA primase DnaG [Candidatus Woesearchaeota archaeon]
MGKISPVSSKYIINASIEIEGVVDRPDVIGAVFGQTEGLLGADLELRELQRSGRIGRIEVNTETRGGKTQGSIIIPSSLDKAETAIVAAALEIIQRIGPCNAKLKVTNIEDVRISKRNFVIERAKELLRTMVDSVMPDSQELAEEVAHSVRIMEITEYGRDRCPAGPGIDEADEVIVVEGRADVLNLLKNGFKNVIAMNGTQVPQTIIDLSRKKDIVVFLDGDRGGNLILKELMNIAEIDFVARAPDGKEVEELAKKEIHKALRSRITIEQAKLELAANDTSQSIRRPMLRESTLRMQPAPVRVVQPQRIQPFASRSASAEPELKRVMPVGPVMQGKQLNPEEKKRFSSMLENLIGTRGAYLLDNKMNVLGKVPFTELGSTLKTLNSGVYAIVFDGSADKEITDIAERAGVKHIIAMDSKVNGTAVNVVTAAEL